MLKTPAEIAELYIMVGEGKTSRRSWNLIALGCFAGAFIALGALCSQIVGYAVQPSGLARLLSALVFPVGLVLVVISGGELFTGNCLIMLSVLAKNTYPLAMLRSWLCVYIGNLLGGILVAFLVNVGNVLSLYNGGLAVITVAMAQAKVSMPFLEAFIKGVLCNFLVCISIWASFASDEVCGKVICLYLPIVLFVACGFEHSVANMFFIPSGIFAKYMLHLPAEGLNWGTMFLKNLLPVTLGNIVGGGFLVGGGYWLIYLSHHDED